jgi:hypothetical protein
LLLLSLQVLAAGRIAGPAGKSAASIGARVSDGVNADAVEAMRLSNAVLVG